MGSQMTGADPRGAVQRRPRSDGVHSREAIVTAAARMATVKGLDGLSIGKLAEYVGMSKSGLYAHFDSKEELQLATIEAAYQVSLTEVIRPALQAETPWERLRALCDRFLDYVDHEVFPGGCFFASASAEFDSRTGIVRDRLYQFHMEWTGLLATQATDARQNGAIGAHEEPEQLVFELDAILHYANSAFVLSRNRAAIERARCAVGHRLAAAAPHLPSRERG